MPTANVNGMNLAYDDLGTGRAVILIHAFPFDRSMWKEQAAMLASGHRLIVPDMRGFGESDPPVTDTSTMEEMARDVAALMGALGIERAIIGGLSMGGYVALSFYRHFPLKVSGLILADTRAQADTDEARAGRIAQSSAILENGMEVVADSLVEKLLGPETLAGKPEVVSRVRSMILAVPPAGAAAAQKGMAERIDQSMMLPRIFPPTLIIVGADDKVTPVADAQSMRREIRGSRLEIIDGAGHLSNLEAPAEFNWALLEFLRSLAP